ncbi:unnamed protein product [Merluccius merluccius]
MGFFIFVNKQKQVRYDVQPSVSPSEPRRVVGRGVSEDETRGETRADSDLINIERMCLFQLQCVEWRGCN